MNLFFFYYPVKDNPRKFPLGQKRKFLYAPVFSDELYEVRFRIKARLGLRDIICHDIVKILLLNLCLCVLNKVLCLCGESHENLPFFFAFAKLKQNVRIFLQHERKLFVILLDFLVCDFLGVIVRHGGRLDYNAAVLCLTQYRIHHFP